MKLSRSILLAAVTIGSSHGQWDGSNNACNDCVEHADTFKTCTLKYCVDENAKCLDEPVPIPRLSTCCYFQGNECTESARAIDTCLNECLPECVLDSMTDYMDCVLGSSSSCSMEDCITKIALENDFAGVTMEDNDAFFEELKEALEDKGKSDATNCDQYESKKVQICDVGSSCCERCNDKLGEMMECITNEMILPWQSSINSNANIDDCDMDCDRRRRQLDGHETNMTDENSAKSKELTKECIEGMKFAIALGNKNEAGSGAMECMVVNGARALKQPEEVTSETGSSAAQASVLSAFLIAMAASTLA